VIQFAFSNDDIPGPKVMLFSETGEMLQVLFSQKGEERDTAQEIHFVHDAPFFAALPRAGRVQDTSCGGLGVRSCFFGPFCRERGLQSRCHRVPKNSIG
jgi:hypothetical protein